MSFLRNVVATATSDVPVINSLMGAGAGTLLSGKEDITDKLKTGLATGVGASAGVVLPAAYESIVDKIIAPETKARTLWRKLNASRDWLGENWYDKIGKNREVYERFAPYKNMNVEELMEKARKAGIRRNAAAKAKRIFDKVKAKNTKLKKVLAPLTLASMIAGGYTGYNYMED